MPARAAERACRELVQVPLDVAGGMQAAAIYLAVLAFPESKAKRTAFLEDVKAFNVKEALALGWKGNPPARYRKRTLRALEVSGPLVTAARRLERDRMPACEIALGLMLRGAFKDRALEVKLSIAGTAVDSLNAGALGLARLRKKLPATEAEHAHNFLARGWRASRPVLHLAMALRIVLDALQRGQDAAPAPSIMGLIQSPAWVPGAIRQAEQLRTRLAARARPLWVATSDTICLVPLPQLNKI